MTWRKKGAHFWRDAYSPEMRARLEEYDVAQEVRIQMGQAGYDSTNRGQVISFLRGEDPLADLPGRAVEPDNIFDEMGDLGIDIVEQFRGMDELAAGLQKDAGKADRVIKALRTKLQARGKTEARSLGRQGEAAVNARASRSRLDILLDRAEIYASIDAELSSRLDALQKQKGDVRGKFEAIVKEWEGDTTRAARNALRRVEEMAAERQKQIDAGTYQGRAARLTGADDAVDKAVRTIVNSDRGKIDAELRAQAKDIVRNMMASPDGRLPYEWGETASKQARASSAFSGDGDANIPFLKERRFPVPDGEMLDVMDNDIRRVFHAYVHSMIPQAEMQKMFGDVRGEAAIRAIQEEYGAKIAEAATEAERLKLREAMNADIKDFAGMRDRILGVYGLPSDPESLFYRGAKVATQLNFLSKMGMMVVSSVADAGAAVMRHGLGRSFEALGAGLNRFSKDPEIARAAKAEKQILEDAGVALEMVLGSRAMSFAEIAADYGRASKFERGLQSSTAAFSFINLARQWDTAMQTVAGVASLRRIMRNVEDWSKGDISPGEAEFMASLNIGKDQAGRIWKAAEAGEGERLKGVLIPEGRTWTDKDAYDMMRVALKQSVDSTIIKPGQDKPLVASTPVGRVLFQFRSFIISAHQRLLLAGLQQADANMGIGAATMLGLGTLSVAMSDLARSGQLKEREPGEWLIEGFDRSGIPGWLMEVNNVAEKVSGQQFGLRPLAGAEPAARSVNQSRLDAVFGPTVGFATDAIRIVGAPMRGELAAADTRAVRNQIPMQNLFWLRHVFNAAHDSVDRSLGIEKRPN